MQNSTFPYLGIKPSTSCYESMGLTTKSRHGETPHP